MNVLGSALINCPLIWFTSSGLEKRPTPSCKHLCKDSAKSNQIPTWAWRAAQLQQRPHSPMSHAHSPVPALRSGEMEVRLSMGVGMGMFTWKLYKDFKELSWCIWRMSQRGAHLALALTGTPPPLWRPASVQCPSPFSSLIHGARYFRIIKVSTITASNSKLRLILNHSTVPELTLEPPLNSQKTAGPVIILLIAALRASAHARGQHRSVARPRVADNYGIYQTC